MTISLMTTQERILHNLRVRDCLDVAIRVSEATGVPLDDLLGRKRHKSIASARRELYHALRWRGMSLPEIGSLLERDHTTILSGLRPSGSRKQGTTDSTTLRVRVAS